MKTMSRRVMVAVVAVLAVAVVAWAQAPAGGGMQHPMQPGQMGQGQGRGMMGPMQGGPMGMLAQLNLTDQQKQQIHTLMMDAQPQQQADMQQMQKLHEQLKAQVFADAGPSGDAKGTAQEISTLQAKMMHAHIAIAEKIAAILTPDQRKQVRDMPMDGMMEMMGMGGPMHPGPPKK
jgi:Spy/CpxP family protein refolding chaperone